MRALILLIVTLAFTAPLSASPPQDDKKNWVLGPTGIKADSTGTVLIVREVFSGSPASEKVRVGDRIVGAGGSKFTNPYKAKLNYKAKADCNGQLRDFGNAIEEAEGGDGKLALTIERGGKTIKVTLKLEVIGRFSKTFPYDCKKSTRIFNDICEHLAKTQKGNGTWGKMIPPTHVTAMAGLTLLASGNPKYRKNVQRAAKSLTGLNPEKTGYMGNWCLTFTAIFLGEYYLVTKDKSVLETLRNVNKGLVLGQFKEGHITHTRWRDFTTSPKYPELGIMAGMAMTAWGYLKACKVPIDQRAYDKNLKWLKKLTGSNGNVSYSGGPGSGLSDPGRTAAAVLGHLINRRGPTEDAYIRKGTKYLGDAYLDYPDGHSSPSLGIMLAALASALDPRKFRKIVDYHVWYFNLIRTHKKGRYITQPTRDLNLDYSWDSPSWTTACVGVIFALQKKNLRILGGSVYIEGISESELTPLTKPVFAQIQKENYGRAYASLENAKKNEDATGQDKEVIAKLEKYFETLVAGAVAEMDRLDREPDVLRLRESITKLKKVYRGIGPFDARVSEIEKTLREPFRKNELKVGKMFYSVLKRFTPGRSSLKTITPAEVVKELRKFGEKNDKSNYGKAARLMATQIEKGGDGFDIAAYFESVRKRLPRENK